MSIVEVLALSAALSADAFGIGLSCAVRGIKNPLSAKLLISLISAAVTAAAVFLGGIIGGFLPETTGKIAGAVMLIVLGSYTGIGAVREERKKKNTGKESRTVLSAAAEIIRDPSACDMDHSEAVEIREAVYIGAALSADSFSAGIGTGMGGAALSVPIFCGLFQLFMLSSGEFAGNLIRGRKNIKQIWFSVLSALILILVGIVKLIF